MLSLLIDTSNKNLSVGIANDGELIDFVEREAWQRQSEFLIDTIDKLFKKHALDPKSIKAVVASKGPGSYTGVRIAVTVAKVISVALGVPLYLISSLKAMSDGDNPSICVMNARSKRSYVGVYKGSDTILSDRVIANDELLDYIAQHPDYSIVGETSQLGIAFKAPNLFPNLLAGIDPSNEVSDPLAAKPTYLKDLA